MAGLAPIILNTGLGAGQRIFFLFFFFPRNSIIKPAFKIFEMIGKQFIKSSE